MKSSSRYVSLLALSTGPEASAAAQEIIQSANGIQMHANSCAHTQIRLQLSQELFANVGYHLNHYSALVTTDGWSIWLSMRLASQPVLETIRNLHPYKVTSSNSCGLIQVGGGSPKVCCGKEQVCWKMTLGSHGVRKSQQQTPYDTFCVWKTRTVRHTVCVHSFNGSSLVSYRGPGD